MFGINILKPNFYACCDITGGWNSWPFLFAFNAVPALICLIAFPLCPESPRFLLIKKADEDAAKKGRDI